MSDPTNNGTPVSAVSEEEHERRLAEIRSYLRRMLVLALGRIPEDSLTLLALDQPGLVTSMRCSTKKRGAEITIGVPDELVRNLAGPVEGRDLVILMHLPASTKARLEGVDAPLILTPEGGTG